MHDPLPTPERFAALTDKERAVLFEHLVVELGRAEASRRWLELASATDASET